MAICILSCNNINEAEKPAQTKYLKDQIEAAVELWENGDSIGARHYVDSIYAQQDNITITDRYEYYYFFSDRYSRSGRPEESELYLDSMLMLIEDAQLTHVMKARYAQANYFKGDRLLDKGQYEKAFQYYYVAQSIAKESSDSCALAYYNYKTAWVSYRSERFGNAINFFEVAFDQFGACNDDFAFFYRRQQILDNIGLSFFNLGMPDSAIKYYDSALRFIELNRSKYPEKKQEQCEMANAVIWGNLGSAYYELGEKEQAEKLFIKSIHTNEQPNFDKIDAQFTRIKLANLYLEAGDVQRMLEIVSVVKSTLNESPNPTVEMRWNDLMWKYYDKDGRDKKAYKHLLRANELRDSINLVNKKTHPADLDERVSIIEHTYQLEALEEKEEKQKAYLFIAILTSILCIIIIALVVTYWRRSRKHVSLLMKMNEQSKVQQQELKKALNELEELSNEKDRILKAVSHDMRSPINSSLALVDILGAENDNFTSEQEEYLSLIKSSNENALNLTKDLLELATLNTESLEKEGADITALIEERVKLLSFKAAEKQQKLVFKAPDNHISAKVNAEKISRVVNNLITNAIKFSPGNSEIKILLQIEGSYFRITVSDNGIGIPDHLKPKVFNLFSEAKRFGTSGEQPFGLGLSISKQITEAHDGRIWFESKETVGTTFYVEVPMGI